MLRGRNLRSHLLESKKAACGRWRDPSASKPKKRTGRVLVRRHKNIGAKHALLRCGATDVTRTHDLLITNQLLYRLSYTSIFLTACTFYHMSPGMSTKKFDDYYLFSCMKKCCIPAQIVDFLRFMSVVQNLHCYSHPENTRGFRHSRSWRRSKFLHFRDNTFT